MFSVWKVIKSFFLLGSADILITRISHVCTAVMPSIPQARCFPEGPGSGWSTQRSAGGPYTAAWKLIIHLHSRLYIQGLQIGSWKQAMMGGFTFRTLWKKIKRNQGFTHPAHQPPPTPHPAPESWILNISALLDLSSPDPWYWRFLLSQEVFLGKI